MNVTAVRRNHVTIKKEAAHRNRTDPKDTSRSSCESSVVMYSHARLRDTCVAPPLIANDELEKIIRGEFFSF